VTNAVLAVLSFGLLLGVPARAQRLSANVSPAHYDLVFAVDLEHARFEGDATIRVTVASPTDTIVLNAAELKFTEVTIDEGAARQRPAVSLDPPTETAALSVAAPLAKGNHVVRIRYTGVLNDKLRGFYLGHAGGRPYAATQFEATDARRAFPCFDEPAFKATFSVTVTADRGDRVISNGRLLSDRPADGGWHTVRFSTSPRMSSYLVALAVGDFQCVGRTVDRVPIRVCALSRDTSLRSIAIEATARILTFYNHYFTIKYPYGKLDIVGIPDFAAGAMENTAAIFFREADLLADPKNASASTRRNIASIIAHEMAHQWFGDLVTMRWWDDLWLNEGFATWMANKPLADWKPEWDIPVHEELETQTALEADSFDSTRPVHVPLQSSAEIDEAFDAIAYEKGAAVLRMVERYVGADTFRTGVNAYLREHAFGTVTSEDFWTAIASASGKPVDRIMPTFITQPGAPLLEVSPTCDGGRTAMRLTQRRFFAQPALQQAPSTERWSLPVCVRPIGGEGGASCDLLSERIATVATASRCTVRVFVNAGGRGYFRTAYPPDAIRAIAPHVGSDLAAPERLSLIDDEWAMARAGRHSAADYLALAAGYARETSAVVLGDVTGKLEFVAQYLSTDRTRPALEEFVRSLFEPVLAELGFTATTSDDDNRRERRAVIIEVLGRNADAAVIAKAQSSLDARLNDGAPLDPTLAAAIIHVAAAHGDEMLYDRLLAAEQAATSPQDYYLFLYAAGDFRDPLVVNRALRRALSQEIRSQDTAIYLSGFFANPEARRAAWSFVKDHWTEIEPKLTNFGGDTGLVGSLGAFCDRASRDDIAGFFAMHPLPGAARRLNQTLEQIDGCMAFKEAGTPIVSAWLAAR
jgi:aminopeptidase N